MSAEILRRAASLMRERAEDATAGPWEIYRNMHDEYHVSEIDRRGFGVISNPATGRDDYGKGNAIHIASWHPAVALAVADWLDGVALYAEARADQQWFDLDGDPIAAEDTHAIGSALAVAHAYLAELA